jgi:hypothetical protein
MYPAWIDDLGQAVEFESFAKLDKANVTMVRSFKRAGET